MRHIKITLLVIGLALGTVAFGAVGVLATFGSAHLYEDHLQIHEIVTFLQRVQLPVPQAPTPAKPETAPKK